MIKLLNYIYNLSSFWAFNVQQFVFLAILDVFDQLFLIFIEFIDEFTHWYLQAKSLLIWTDNF